MRWKLYRASFAAIGALYTTVAQAGGVDEFRIYEENDVFNPFTDATDRFYTQGLRVEWFQHDESSDDPFLFSVDHSDWCDLLCGDAGEQVRFDGGYAVQQTIYTPQNIATAAPQPFDRPWAGLLTGSRIARATYQAPGLGAGRQDTLEISLGISGPPSLAGDAQIVWHDIIDVQRPNGWNNQLKTEPIVQSRFQSALRWGPEEGANADFIVRAGMNLGNAQVAADVQAIGRIGWNLQGFGVNTIAPAMPAPPPPSPESTFASPAIEYQNGPQRRTRWFNSGNVFARAGIRAIAHSFVLDGNTFAENDIRISREPFVPEVAVGAELNLVGCFWVTAQFVHRGSEFETVRGRQAPAQEFGALTIAWVKPL